MINELTGLTIRKYKEAVDKIAESMAEEMGQLIDLFILDFMIGEDNLDDETRDYKYQNLRKGLYDDF